jgi:hypothetical protein
VFGLLVKGEISSSLGGLAIRNDVIRRSFRFLMGRLPNRLWMSLFTFCFFFCLDAKETKDQGKPDRSARFSVPARGISHLIG